MGLDLSALEVPSDSLGLGKPSDILLDDIEEDPNQPRIEFSSEAMREMTNSVKLRGVKTPISVRSHPGKPGKWIVNYGARRYRASLAAGLESIPAFIDEAHDDYDQVIENVQRDDLKPMELALFIKKRLDAGDKKHHIAKHIGKDAAVITRHLALIDPPHCIEETYRAGKCTSPHTLHDLRGLYELFPAEVEAWCVDTSDITRKTVANLADALKGAKTKGTDQGDIIKLSDFGHDHILGDGEGGNTQPASNTFEDDVRDAGALISWPKGRAVSDPDRLSKPLMLVEFEGRSAAVLLNRRPTSAGLLYIRFEDGSGDQEVDAGACKINLLTAAEK